MKTIEELQAELTAKIAKLDEERKANAEQFSKEQAELRIIAEAERAQRIEAIKMAEEKAAKRKLEIQAIEDERIRQAAIEKMELERKQNLLDETLRTQREKLEWLETQISNAEFFEEQHRKSIENQKAQPVLVDVSTEGAKINVEYPMAPLNVANPGESVEGTDGKTPGTPLMSDHLKQILRQATRQY